MIVYISVETSQIFITLSWPTVTTHFRCKSIVIDITLCLVSWNVASGVWLKINKFVKTNIISKSKSKSNLLYITAAEFTDSYWKLKSHGWYGRLFLATFITKSTATCPTMMLPWSKLFAFKYSSDVP